MFYYLDDRFDKIEPIDFKTVDDSLLVGLQDIDLDGQSAFQKRFGIDAFQTTSIAYFECLECTFDYNNFRSNSFFDSHFYDCFFDYADFTKATFEHALFDECVFNGCDFSDISLTKTKFTKCKFVNCDFGNVDMSTSVFDDCAFDDCIIESLTIPLYDMHAFPKFSELTLKKLANFLIENCKNNALVSDEAKLIADTLAKSKALKDDENNNN